jgi:hypothetical protein
LYVRNIGCVNGFSENEKTIFHGLTTDAPLFCFRPCDFTIL